MVSRASEPVSFERRDEENQQIREGNARLPRLMGAPGIPISQPAMDDVPPPANTGAAHPHPTHDGR